MRETKKYDDGIVEQLAKEAGITQDQARKVLEIFHFDRLVEKLQALESIASDQGLRKSLGLAESELRVPDRLNLADFRLGLRGAGMIGPDVIA